MFDRLEIVPGEIVFKSSGEYVQLKVLAHWKDGTAEDVTQLTRFRSNDDSVAIASDTGRVQSAGAGDTHIVAFYDNGVQPIPVMRPVSDKIVSKYPKVAARTRVDELILTKLRKVGIVPRERFEVNALNAIAVMVDRGLGVSLVPDWARPWPEGLKLARLSLPQESVPRRIGVIWSRASVRLRLVTVLLQESIAESG